MGNELDFNVTVLPDITGDNLPDSARQACCTACYRTPNCLYWAPGVLSDSPCSIGYLVDSDTGDACSQGLCPGGVSTRVLLVVVLCGMQAHVELRGTVVDESPVQPAIRLHRAQLRGGLMKESLDFFR